MGKLQGSRVGNAGAPATLAQKYPLPPVFSGKVDAFPNVPDGRSFEAIPARGRTLPPDTSYPEYHTICQP